MAPDGKNYEDLDNLLRQKMPKKAGSSALKTSNSSVFLSDESRSALERVRNLVLDAIHMKNTDLPDLTMDKLREAYLALDDEDRQRSHVVISAQFGVDRQRVLELVKHYNSLYIEGEDNSEGADSARYKTEQDLRSALTPISGRLFEQMNRQAGGLKFLVDFRADLLNTIKTQNLAALRAVDTELKGLFGTWLSPAYLELMQITWDNSATLLEKIVEYEAVHPISNLYDLKRRLGIGRRCYGYFHPTIPGEPLVFIEIALSSEISGSIQDVLFEKPPVAETDASTAVFYSISSTQPGLAGIELGKFLIKRVVKILLHEMPNIQTFVTLSPIPGFMKWLLPKLELQVKQSAPDQGSEKASNPAQSTFREDFLLPKEESSLLNVYSGDKSKESLSAVEILRDTLKSPEHEWAKSKELCEVLRPILMRLCARYLMQEKQRGRALDPVTNFHVRNGAMVERLNWMGNTFPNGLKASAGIMVNYLYRLDSIEANNQAYVLKGVIASSPSIDEFLQSRL